ncbi:hypothetical protein [Thiolapillus sp.]|uniref:hypothetical protein n=1 Tax=Thiolapillus sp. TaxID=2017437 RepID=UPI003AF5E544
MGLWGAVEGPILTSAHHTGDDLDVLIDLVQLALVIVVVRIHDVIDHIHWSTRSDGNVLTGVFFWDIGACPGFTIFGVWVSGITEFLQSVVHQVDQDTGCLVCTSLKEMDKSADGINSLLHGISSI